MKEKYLKNLSEEERFILKDKGTEKPFSGEYNDFTKRVYLFVKHVVRHYMNLKLNLTQDVVGHLLMTRLKEL